MKEVKPELALYRKYRPTVFKDVLGQEHITKVLEGSIRLGRISHAYLFAGSRGTGKTSVARIFAKAVGTAQEDTYEIDAASNTGVDDVRALNDSVHVLPFSSKYKVYIIDEVHMLSKSAFNALLKTLEEPPLHVIFILATTESEKIPETVLSRCQVFTFRKPSQNTLAQVVNATAKKEGFTIESSSADLIAMLSEGSFRDALGNLQKVIASSSDKKISMEEVEIVSGAPKGNLINELILAIHEREIDRALFLVRKIAGLNVDAKLTMKLLLRKIRFILLLRVAPKLKDEIASENSLEDMAFLESIAGDKESLVGFDCLKTLLDSYDQTGRTHVPELPLELALVKIIPAKL